jgi:hypothetical protein
MEHDYEPVRGLPGPLPEGEHIIWQGAPDAHVFARRGMHLRWITAYFAALAIYNLAQGSMFGIVATLVAAAGCIGFLYLFALGVARTSVYTLTNKRIVLRVGVALSACVNVPLKSMASANLRTLSGGHGDIAVSLESGRIAWFFLWPHVRPWRLKSPEPMLRAVPDAQSVAMLLATARAAIGPVPVAVDEPSQSGLVLGVAA